MEDSELQMGVIRAACVKWDSGTAKVTLQINVQILDGKFAEFIPIDDDRAKCLIIRQDLVERIPGVAVAVRHNKGANTYSVVKASD